MSNGNLNGFTPYQNMCFRYGVPSDYVWVIEHPTPYNKSKGYIKGTRVRLAYDDGTDSPIFAKVFGTELCNKICINRIKPAQPSDQQKEQIQEEVKPSEKPNNCPQPSETSAEQQEKQKQKFLRIGEVQVCTNIDGTLWKFIHKHDNTTQQPLKTQIGGDHYKNLRIQPIEYIMLNEIPYIEANVIKYVTRWKSKGGVEDLKKAKHYLDVLINSVEESK